jgi:hypothetical protein
MTRDIPASVRGQLENLAKKSGRPLQELMQYFVMERFLFRLSQSEYADRFVLKGALMFTVWGSPQMSQLIAAIEMGDVRRLVVYAARRYRHLPMPWRVLSHSRESFLASCLTYWKPSSSGKETR